MLRFASKILLVESIYVQFDINILCTRSTLAILHLSECKCKFGYHTQQHQTLLPSPSPSASKDAPAPPPLTVSSAIQIPLSGATICSLLS
jgi:hypothetical protein